LRELHQVRKFFATGIVPDVIQNIQEKDIATCHRYLKEWEENIAADLPFHEQDRYFHLTLCQSVGNQLMLELENIFWTAYRNAEERMVSLHSVKEDSPKILQAHIDILSAIEARDVELAQHLMADSFEEFKRRLELTMQNP
jgi:DNA-binding FadR family transcriptional regulator